MRKAAGAFLPGCACHLPMVRVEGLWLVGGAGDQIAMHKAAGAFLSGCACHLPVVRYKLKHIIIIGCGMTKGKGS